MKYPFPHITHVDQVYEAIKGRDEFKVVDKGTYLVANYFVNFADSFPEVNTADPKLNELYAIRRECRGIIFSKKTGKVIRRPHHKFFNLNERPETLLQNVDMSRPHYIPVKLDGSMIAPFIDDDNVMHWGTKMGVTDIATHPHHFATVLNPHYQAWARDALQSGYTPIFEWCSRKQRIVIDYPEDRLVLTAVRHMETGEYWAYEALITVQREGIEVVNLRPDPVSNWDAFVETVKAETEGEGYIIVFDNGHKLKMKNDEYCRIHKAKDSLSQEKLVLGLILRDLVDDIKAKVAEDERERLDRFQNEVISGILAKAEELKWIVLAARDNCNSKKVFALDVVQKHPVRNEHQLLYKAWDYIDLNGEDGLDLVSMIKDLILLNLGTQTKVDEARNLWNGARWVEIAFDSDA